MPSHPFTQFILRLSFDADSWEQFDADCQNALRLADEKILPKKRKDEIWRVWRKYSHMTASQWESAFKQLKPREWEALFCKRAKPHVKGKGLTASLRTAVARLKLPQWKAVCAREPYDINYQIQLEYLNKAGKPRARVGDLRGRSIDVVASQPIIVQDWPGSHG